MKSPLEGGKRTQCRLEREKKLPGAEVGEELGREDRILRGSKEGKVH